MHIENKRFWLNTFKFMHLNELQNEQLIVYLSCFVTINNGRYKTSQSWFHGQPTLIDIMDVLNIFFVYEERVLVRKFKNKITNQLFIIVPCMLSHV